MTSPSCTNRRSPGIRAQYIPIAVNAVQTFTKSSIGKKWIVALTGLVMFIFVIGHVSGNLQFFLGPEAINHYGQLLRIWPELLWVIRLVLLACLILHVVFTMLVVIENRKARPQKYACQTTVQARLSTKLMALSGVLLLVFILFHLAHFTTHSVDRSFDAFKDEKGRHDVYRMLVVAFSNPVMAGSYALAMIFLCSHLSHGAWSWLQTLGLRTKKVSEGVNRGARILALVLAIGYVSIPAAVLMGLGKGYVAERERAAQAARQSPDSNPQITQGRSGSASPEKK
jgi:succinate dehydrogenase / fumarate reductase, cytochrome b subunit